MTSEERYGSLFVSKLRKLSGITPFNYRGLNETHGLNQEQLARRMQKKSYVLFQIIGASEAEHAAEITWKQQQKHHQTALAWMDGGTCLTDLLTIIADV